jgi:hypothetical protein
MLIGKLLGIFVGFNGGYLGNKGSSRGEIGMAIVGVLGKGFRG